MTWPLPLDRLVMSSRGQGLVRALAGLERTGVPLVGLDGSTYYPAGITDDPGLYAVVPLLARALGGSIELAASVFLFGVVGLGALLGLGGCWWLFRSWGARLVSLVALGLLTYVTTQLIRDVYVIAPALTMAVVPGFLALAMRRRWWMSLVIAGLLAGLAIGVGNTIRSHAGTAIALFLLVVIVWYLPVSRTRRTLVAGSLLAGILLAGLLFGQMIRARDAYLARTVPGYERTEPGHPVWHSVYLGFGYLDNPLGIRYLDAVAAARVAEVDPAAGYVSARYEAILRDEVIRLVRTQGRFVLETIAAKMGVLFLYYLPVFANLGLVAALLVKKPRAIDGAFAVALGFASLPGILVMPSLPYVSGFMAMATMFAIVSLGHALDHGWPSHAARAREA